MAIDCERLKKAHLNAVIAHIRKDAPSDGFYRSAATSSGTPLRFIARRRL